MTPDRNSACKLCVRCMQDAGRVCPCVQGARLCGIQIGWKVVRAPLQKALSTPKRLLHACGPMLLPLLQEFYDMLSADPSRAFYGPGHVFAAAELGEGRHVAADVAGCS